MATANELVECIDRHFIYYPQVYKNCQEQFTVSPQDFYFSATVLFYFSVSNRRWYVPRDTGNNPAATS